MVRVKDKEISYMTRKLYEFKVLGGKVLEKWQILKSFEDQAPFILPNYKGGPNLLVELKDLNRRYRSVLEDWSTKHD